MGEEPALDMEQKSLSLTTEPSDSPAGGNHAVAGDDNRVGVGTAGPANGAWRALDRFGQLAVADRLAVRYGCNVLPHLALERCADWRQWQVEGHGWVVQISSQLAHSLLGQRCLRRLLRVGSQIVDADDLTVVTTQANTEARCRQNGLIERSVHDRPSGFFMECLTADRRA